MSRRDDLLAAAARRFVAVGIRKTTMEEIAREAGAGKATLYRYFDNKDAVVDALLDREAERFARVMRRATEEEATAAGRLEAAFAAGVEFFVQHPVLTKGRDEEPGLLLPRITAAHGPLVASGLELLTGLVRGGVATGELRGVDARHVAEGLLRLILSYFSFPPIVVRVDEPGRARRFAHEVITAGLVAGGGSRPQPTGVGPSTSTSI